MNKSTIQEKARAAGACKKCEHLGTVDCAWLCNYVDVRKVDRFPAITLEEIKQRVEEIKDSYGESQHSKEDELYRDFVKYVSRCKSYRGLREMAKEILKTEDMEFARWCA